MPRAGGPICTKIDPGDGFAITRCYAYHRNFGPQHLLLP